jgi:hypothetical protein
VKGALRIGNTAKFQFLQTICGNCHQPAVFFTDFPVFKQKKQMKQILLTQSPTPRVAGWHRQMPRKASAWRCVPSLAKRRGVMRIACV